MAYECFEACRFRPATVELIEAANRIIESFQAEGYDLTLRQLYYQFVQQNLLANTQENYSRLGDIVSRARRAGLIDWDAIVDRTRFLRGFPSWESPESIAGQAARSFRVDPWLKQPVRVEVWFEKDAVLGIFQRACEKWRIPYFSCRGYASDSELHTAAERLGEYCMLDSVVILHFGDHDPSGLDMTRDIESRLRLFGAPDHLEIRRLALNMDQVRKYRPPPNPAKETDSRFKGYRREFGNSSWELDALDPRTLTALVEEEASSLVDHSAWNEAILEEDKGRRQLELIHRHFAGCLERAEADEAKRDVPRGKRASRKAAKR